MTPARDRDVDQAVARGSEQLKRGQLAEAQQTFRAAYAMDPDSVRVLALLGLTYFRGGQFDQAQPIYEELVERAPTDASHRLNLGLVYLKLNDADHAIMALEASRALDPSQGRAVSYLGLAYARAGRYAEAYRSFLLAGQNDLATEIEANLTAAERDGIHSQLQRTPSGPLPVVSAIAQSRTESGPIVAPIEGPDRQSEPFQLVRRDDVDELGDLGNPPTPPPPEFGELFEDVPAPVSPSADHADDEPDVDIALDTMAAAPAAAPAPAARAPAADPTQPRRDLAHPANPRRLGGDSIPPLPAAPQAPPPRMTESMQFVLPKSDGTPAPLDGQSQLSRSIQMASPASATAVFSTPSGPRPLAELATEDLVRPDDGDHPFEVTPTGALIVRIVDRTLSRLDGVHITGGDLAFEPAMRRSRGSQTDEPFDHGGTRLHVVTGQGWLIATPSADDDRKFAAVMLDDDIFYLRENLVFAFEARLRWENGNVPGLRGKLPVVQFRGDGAVAMRLARPLVRVKLPPQGLLFVEVGALAGWIGRVVPRAVMLPAGGPMSGVCVECTGEGIVLVDPPRRDALAAVTALMTTTATVADAPPAEAPAPPAIDPDVLGLMLDE